MSQRESWPPGTIAVDWENRAVHIRSHEDNYWYDSRSFALGRILLRDEWVTPGRYEIIQPTGTRWSTAPPERPRRARNAPSRPGTRPA